MARVVSMGVPVARLESHVLRHSSPSSRSAGLHIRQSWGISWPPFAAAIPIRSSRVLMS